MARGRLRARTARRPQLRIRKSEPDAVAMNSVRTEFIAHEERARLLAQKRRRMAVASIELVLVVRRATKGDILNRRRSATSERHDMVVLEESRLGAASFRSDKRAPPRVPLPDAALYKGPSIAILAARG
jgi:hypothetical protein